MMGSHLSVESKKVISDLGFFRVLLAACGLRWGGQVWNRETG